MLQELEIRPVGTPAPARARTRLASSARPAPCPRTGCSIRPVGLGRRAAPRSGARIRPRSASPVSSLRSIGERLRVLAEQPLDGASGRGPAARRRRRSSYQTSVVRTPPKSISRAFWVGLPVICSAVAWRARLPTQTPEGIDRAEIEGWFDGQRRRRRAAAAISSGSPAGAPT